MAHPSCPICQKPLVTTEMFDIANGGFWIYDIYLCSNNHVFRGAEAIDKVRKEISDGVSFDPNEGPLPGA